MTQQSLKKNKNDDNKNAKMNGSQKIFLSVNVILIVICLMSVKGFFKFREDSKAQGIYVFQVSSLIWCLVTFVCRYLFKHCYFKYMHNILSKIMSHKPQQNQQDKLYRLNSLKKLTFDTLYYSSISIATFIAFKDEYWFPKLLGGNGQCNQIYLNYPHWPSQNNKQKTIQIFYMIHMGVYIYQVFQLLVIKGRSYRKFYEWLLHHFMSLMLIFFSLMSNQVKMGLTVLLVHTVSDIFSSSARAYLETKYLNKIVVAIKFIIMLGSWIYMRLIVYPFCLVKYTYMNTPGPEDIWYSIKYQHLTIVIMAGLLVFMHAFWIYYMVLFGLKNIKKGNLQNPHQQLTRTSKTKQT